jgi:hypothetical protein
MNEVAAVNTHVLAERVLEVQQLQLAVRIQRPYQVPGLAIHSAANTTRRSLPCELLNYHVTNMPHDGCHATPLVLAHASYTRRADGSLGDEDLLGQGLGDAGGNVQRRSHPRHALLLLPIRQRDCRACESLMPVFSQ